MNVRKPNQFLSLGKPSWRTALLALFSGITMNIYMAPLSETKLEGSVTHLT